MFRVKRQDQICFIGITTSTPEREFLRERGFVHVTGLRVVIQGHNHRIGDHLRPNECACWETSGDVTAVTTPGGEVWLRAGTYHLSADEERFLMLKGRGGNVPLSSFCEYTYQHKMLLARFIDPDAGIVDD